MNRLLQKAEPQDCLHGGVLGRSIRTYARDHYRKEVVIKCDIEDFFPSVGNRMVYRSFIRLGCAPQVARYITRLTTLYGCLPQGSPTSTTVGNIVLAPLAIRLDGLARTVGGNVGIYVDDIAFSGSSGIQGLVKLMAKIVNQVGFNLNSSKTRVMFSWEVQEVAGIRVNYGPDITPSYLKHLDHEIAQFESERALLSSERTVSFESVCGKIAYVRKLNAGTAKLRQRRLERSLLPTV